MRYFCTYFDRNYLAKGLCMLRSLARWHPGNVTIFVVCMDELTRIILEKLDFPQVRTIPFHLIEQGDERLLECKRERSVVEYLWTCTPTIILRVLERNPEIDILTYLDADMFCYGATDAIFREFEGSSVLIHEHRFPQHLQHLIRYGRFNVGLLCFRRNREAFTVLEWWREKCLEWCGQEESEGRFGDQKYLDVWPTTFEKIKVTENIGVGTAPWNHSQYVFSKHNAMTRVNDTQLLVYHFHAFQILNEGVIVPAGNTDYHVPMSFYGAVLIDYLNELDVVIAQIRSVDPEFMFGLQKDDFSLTNDFAFLIRTRLLPHFQNAGLPENPIALSSEWTLFPGRVTMKSS